MMQNMSSKILFGICFNILEAKISNCSKKLENRLTDLMFIAM